MSLLEDLLMSLQKQVREIENDKVALERDFVALREKVNDLKIDIEKMGNAESARVETMRRKVDELESQIERFSGRVEGAQSAPRQDFHMHGGEGGKVVGGNETQIDARDGGHVSDIKVNDDGESKD